MSTIVIQSRSIPTLLIINCFLSFRFSPFVANFSALFSAKTPFSAFDLSNSPPPQKMSRKEPAPFNHGRCAMVMNGQETRTTIACHPMVKVKVVVDCVNWKEQDEPAVTDLKGQKCNLPWTSISDTTRCAQHVTVVLFFHFEFRAKFLCTHKPVQLACVTKADKILEGKFFF